MGRTINTLLTLALLLACLAPACAQLPRLPAAYVVEEGNNKVLRHDFDGDGKADLLAAVIKRGTEEEVRLLAVMGRKRPTQRTSQPLPFCCGSLSRQGQVATVRSKGMRGFSYYKFRWDVRVADFRLIGYETESFGNAANDGSGRSSLNLLTGAYLALFRRWDEKAQKLRPMPPIKRKLSIGRRIYLKDFGEEADEWLSELSAKQLPAELR